MGFVSYQLSTPPSVNKLWKPVVKRGANGRAHAEIKKRPAYGMWLEVAGWEIASQRQGQRPMRDDQRVKATYLIERPKKSRDLDNYLKALNDALVRFGVIKDDSLIEEIEAKFADNVKGVIIMLEEVVPCA